MRRATEPGEADETVSVTSPVDGRVLRVLRSDAGAVTQGESLVEIGDPAALEVVAPLVTSDAVLVKEGASATLLDWGGERPLRARVRRVEPSGYTKVSALGIEEQRVDVVLAIEEPSADAAALGDGFGLEVHVATWESADAVTAPVGALFRTGAGWSAFVVREGRASRVSVEPGHWTDEGVEVVSGLAAGDVVVTHPPDVLADGDRVRAEAGP